MITAINISLPLCRMFEGSPPKSDIFRSEVNNLEETDSDLVMKYSLHLSSLSNLSIFAIRELFTEYRSRTVDLRKSMFSNTFDSRPRRCGYSESKSSDPFSLRWWIKYYLDKWFHSLLCDIYAFFVVIKSVEEVLKKCWKKCWNFERNSKNPQKSKKTISCLSQLNCNPQ